MSEPKEPVPKRPRGRPKKYDNWFEFNCEYHKMMDNERKKRPDVRAKKTEYQRQYRQRKKRSKRRINQIFWTKSDSGSKINQKKWPTNSSNLKTSRRNS